MKLKDIKLEVVSITRQSIIDATYVGCCDNCGKMIVNIAHVKDGTGKTYDIGLDCKKQLIDKPIMDKITDKYELKTYKSDLSEVTKFLKFCAYPNIKVELNSDIIIWDMDAKNEHFPDDIKGNIVYMQNPHYLFKLGLKEFIYDLMKRQNKI